MVKCRLALAFRGDVLNRRHSSLKATSERQRIDDIGLPNRPHEDLLTARERLPDCASPLIDVDRVSLPLTVSLDQCNNFVASVTLSSSEVEELANIRDHGTALRGYDDAHATSPGEVEQTFITKDVQRADDRVLVDPENQSQVDRRGQAFTLGGFTLGDGAPNLGGHLLVESSRIVLVNLGRSHGTVRHSTILSVVTGET